jgi:RNA polymerase sigma factor (sigma-70 family)
MPTLAFIIYLPKDAPFRIKENPAQYHSNSCLEEELERVRRVLCKLINFRVQNNHDAEDLVQETLLTIASKYPDMNLTKSLTAWGVGILRKKIGNYYKKMHRSIVFAGEGFAKAKGARHMPLQESLLHYRELLALIHSILATFPAQQQSALRLLCQGLGTKEIVEELHPELYHNTALRLHRGRKILAQELSRLGYGPENKPILLLKAGCRKRKHLIEAAKDSADYKE